MSAVPSLAERHPVVVVGAGPIGLAAAAHLHRYGIPFRVFEAGPEAAWGVARWGYVRLFSPWSWLLDPVCRELLEGIGWRAPEDLDALPTGEELRRRYLLPLARHPALADRIHTGVRVTRILRSRQGSDSRRGVAQRDRSEWDAPARARFRVQPIGLEARAVLDASGCLDTPVPLGQDGRPARGEHALGARLTRGIPRDPAGLGGLRTLVVGSGHTAMGAILRLVAPGLSEPGPRTRPDERSFRSERTDSLDPAPPGTRILWGIRGPGKVSARGTSDPPGAPPPHITPDILPARGALERRVKRIVRRGSVDLLPGLRIRALEYDPARPNAPVRVLASDRPPFRVDHVIGATGYRPDLGITRDLRLSLDARLEAPEALTPLIDPATHSSPSVERHGVEALTHPYEPGYWTIGMKSYGRASTFLMKTGFEQVRSVVAWLAGDREAARSVHPEAASHPLYDEALEENRWRNSGATDGRRKNFGCDG